MTPLSPTVKCPHCGGVSGFTVNVVMKAKQILALDGTPVDTDSYTIVSETDPRFADIQAVAMPRFVRNNLMLAARRLKSA